MSKPRAPKAPDYTQLAQQQGQQNTEAARLAAQLNRVNTQGPGGSVSYTRNGDSWTQTTTLSPEQQRLYDLQAGTAEGAAGAAQQRVAQIGGMSAPDFSNLPSRVSSVQAAPHQTNINAPSVGRTSLDFSGAPGLTDDFSAERQRVEDSIYSSATSRLDPQFARNDEAMRSRLLASGIREGSEAWDTEMQRAAWEKQDAYGNARDRAIQAGGAEQSRLFADALARRQQSVGETATAGTFENQAAQQRFGNETTRAQLYNQGQDTNFAQGVTNAGLTNQARDSGINESTLQRSIPFQELLQLYGIQGPSANVGQAAPQVQGPQPADIYGAGVDQYNANLNRYNANQASNNNIWGSLIGLGGLFL